MMSNNQIEDVPLPSIETGNPETVLLSTGIQIYFPLGKILQVGILFEPTGLIKIYIQVNIITEDIVIQFKVIELNTPITLTQLFLNLGIAHYYSQTFIVLTENIKSKINGNLTKQIQTNLEDALKKIKELNEKIM
ncbi:MAG: hypothetical protein P4L59_16255 [Desulfosporosinus sp.]|nr:hypothetical protein [Desulfosporosinus sp.]